MNALGISRSYPKNSAYCAVAVLLGVIGVKIVFAKSGDIHLSRGHRAGVLTLGSDSINDDACRQVPAPSSNVVKTAVTTSDVATRYNLGDTLRFGEGITTTEANWTLEGTDEAGSWAEPGTDTSTVLATDRALQARDSHTYMVHVRAIIDAGVIGSEDGTCQPENSNTNGRFLNEATLNANGKASQSRDCLEPVKNPRGYSLFKSSGPANGSTVWPGKSIECTLTVRNIGAIVTDEMAGWQHAATMIEGSLMLSGGESVIEGSKLIWTVGDLAVGEEKTLTYSITVDLDAWSTELINVATGTGDVPPSKTVHPNPEKTVTIIPIPPTLVPPVVVPPHQPVPPLVSTGADNSTLWVLSSGALILLLGAAFTAVSRRRKDESN